MAEKKPGMFRRSAQAVKENKSGSYKIKSGDTLSQIAKSRGTTVKKLMEMNPSIKNANQIRAGASLKVPPKTEVSQMTGRKSSPYRGMTSKEITSGRMRSSGSKTSGAKAGAKAGGTKKESAMDRFNRNKAESRKQAREEIPVAAKKGGAMKKTKGYAKGGAMKKTKGYAKGGKMPMVMKDGKKVPAFAADGKGKMMGGGMTKKTKGYAKGGAMKKTKGYAKGGAMKKTKGYSRGGVARGRGAATKGGRFTRGG
jgi:Tfp pilus assembly protein FimV